MSRLFEQYNSEIKKSLQEKFQYGNVMEIPKLEKIVINIGAVSYTHLTLPTIA